MVDAQRADSIAQGGASLHDERQAISALPAAAREVQHLLEDPDTGPTSCEVRDEVLHEAIEIGML